MNSFCHFVSRPLTLQGLRHLLGPFHLVLPSSLLRSILLSRRTARCPASAVNSICSCESHGTARGDSKEQTKLFSPPPTPGGATERGATTGPSRDPPLPPPAGTEEKISSGKIKRRNLRERRGAVLSADLEPTTTGTVGVRPL